MSDQYVGEIRLFAGNFAPEGWAFCNGQLMPISQNDALYSLIGTTYGGDGQTTFALPDLRGRVSMSQGTSGGVTYVMGQRAGSETETLVTTQMPSHTHIAAANSESGTQQEPTNGYWAQSALNQYATTVPNSTMNASSIQTAGGSQPHENMMPTLTLSYIIALQGIYPSQN